MKSTLQLLKRAVYLAATVATLAGTTINSQACSATNPCGLKNTLATWDCPAGFSCGGVACVYFTMGGVSYLVGVYGTCTKGNITEKVGVTLSPKYS